MRNVQKARIFFQKIFIENLQIIRIVQLFEIQILGISGTHN